MVQLEKNSDPDLQRSCHASPLYPEGVPNHSVELIIVAAESLRCVCPIASLLRSILRMPQPPGYLRAFKFDKGLCYESHILGIVS